MKDIGQWIKLPSPFKAGIAVRVDNSIWSGEGGQHMGLNIGELYTIKEYYPKSGTVVLDAFPNVLYNEILFETVGY